ncbi:aminotransferase class III-fold pyridoxal phosphate-dependent enzyme [Pontibacter sp. G13]|uniref:aminotransferase class III-fold pyridoxal phosphate-dependent enzyme n=1 Tax=Pontibacter sp. G13 TaxID=3074898 RepID=UPI00288B8292|nr:aminotransferase class III-fold pyridoxal phosphate-dependent enzyme [Pontibacter sp. G13]WNJ17080.1 aminotransferase class III-fold pyridoxal phosphate-dependent enzyme [Pontibacter sp. G13]
MTRPSQILTDPAQLASQYFGISGISHPLPGEFDLNARITQPDGSCFLLKVAPIQQTQEELEMQHQLLHAAGHHPALQQTPKPISALDGASFVRIPWEDGSERFLRMLTWLPGRLWASVHPQTPKLRRQLGRICGSMVQALSQVEHAGLERPFLWDVKQMDWVEQEVGRFSGERHQLISRALENYRQQVVPQGNLLRTGPIHNDANDYNVVVSESLTDPEVIGLIDFGDAIHSWQVAELAVAGTYAIMGLDDPLEGMRDLVRGFHEAFPLQEPELKALHGLVGARLVLSLTHSTKNMAERPDNEYLQISAKPAWELLEKWLAIPPYLAEAAFREICGFEPAPNREQYDAWLKAATPEFGPLFDPNWKVEELPIWDLSVGSWDLGLREHVEDDQLLQQRYDAFLRERKAKGAIGRYDETRSIYTADHYLVDGNEGPIWRSVHLGLDIFLPAETLVMAPLAGVVHSVKDNAGHRDYGPTIILRHEQEGVVFYTLYGHLSKKTLTHLKPGHLVQRGDTIGWLGALPENGHWPPHLHFQIMLDDLGGDGDFPGVCFPHHRNVWTSLCPNPQAWFALPQQIQAGSIDPPEAMMPRRQTAIGYGLSVSYRDPLHMLQASGPYLYDHTGRRYLDTVNNVPHVGHQHPQVVHAAQRQLEVLNTNTRYLHETLLAYAEELAATLPDPLSVVHFVNSGSEANELALRMAQTYSGAKDMVVLETGYHGNTTGCVAVSSYKFDGKGGQGAEDHIHVVPMPDPYRGPYRGNTPESAQQYAEHVGTAIENMQRGGKQLAGFIHETILSCGGQIVPPEGYLKSAYEYVRAAGGICIADEVQTGMGRVGDAFWSFELQGVVPDIVTMGKPIGNGHPLGAVVCTPEVARAFANGMEYFNTFGGNPVSSTIGREVLRIVQSENLQAHARQVGEFLLTGLRDLQAKYPIIGDVRGHGLFLGFELVKDPETFEPAAEETAYLANTMRRRGILMSTDGPLYNVIKIKPPLAFGLDHAQYLLEQLDLVLHHDVFKR